MEGRFTGKILLSGSSGLIGSALARAAEAKKIQIVQLSRKKTSNSNFIQWNPEGADPVAPSDLERLEGASAAIHLSGTNLSAHRWTTPYKKEIHDSRTHSTRALVRLFGQMKAPPLTFLCASATGIYGDRGEEVLNEDSSPGQGFLPEVCTAWETEARHAAEIGIRTLHTRFGVVLAREGGALPLMLRPFRLGLGGKLGSGRQWFSWITLEDLVSSMFFLMQSPAVAGPVNFVAPQPIRNEEFTKILAQILHRPAVFRVPRFALKFGLGQMADDALLASTRAVPDRLLSHGFVFRQGSFQDALRSLI